MPFFHSRISYAFPSVMGDWYDFQVSTSAFHLDEDSKRLPILRRLASYKAMAVEAYLFTRLKSPLANDAGVKVWVNYNVHINFLVLLRRM